MRRLPTLMLVALAGLAPAAVAAGDAVSIAGSWRGPWYRGMSSGLMALDISPDGQGTVAFTNLETFGQAPAALIKTATQGDWFEFSAIGAQGHAFAARLKRTADGRMLRGAARYEGFQFKFDLQRSE